MRRLLKEIDLNTLSYHRTCTIVLPDWSQNHGNIIASTPGRDESASWLTLLLSQGSSLQLQEPIHIAHTRTLTHRQLVHILIQQVHILEPPSQDMVLHGLILMVIINRSLVHCSSLPLPSQLSLPRRRPYLRVLSELPSLLITLYTPANLPQLLRQVARPLEDIKNSPTSKDCSQKSFAT